MVWQAGQSLKGNRYIIQRKIGSGGFGITYLAQDGKGRQWVIKTILDELINSFSPDKRNKYLRDFKNEALLLALCRHPHIVHIDNIFNEQDIPCIVMEYIQGMDLKKRVEDRGALSEAEAVRYIRQIGEALMVVHDKGFLHRDLKPENIMVRPTQDEAVLIDFGIARDFVLDVTQRHTGYRTEGFAPIEQYDEQGHRGEYTDVYALAATFVTLVTGAPPPPSFMRAVRDRFQVPTGVSTAVQNAIKEGMALQPEDRTQTVEAWLNLLRVSTANIQRLPPLPPPPTANIQDLPPPAAKIQNLPFPPPIFDIDILATTRYQELERLLQAGNWRGADQETAKQMLAMTKRTNDGWLRVEDIDNFPCEDLCAIDGLWVKYSKGRFGFSVQKRIYQSLGGTREYDQKVWDAFADQVGWQKEGGWTISLKSTFDVEPDGYLP